MAVVAPVSTQLETLYGHTHQITWTLTNGDTGGGVSLSGSTDRSAHAFGTFGAAGSVSMEGSNEVAGGDPTLVTSWVTLHDPQGLAFTMTAAKIEEVAEATTWIRPHCTAGDGTTSITIALLLKRTL